jgi:D-tyrosyl-tRNA(Tyr) deacylase
MMARMRAVVQRVSRASVTVDGEVVGRVDGPGLVVLLGITHDDGPARTQWLARKVRELRILRDERSAAELGATILVISQFTLYGDARKGRRPTWHRAAPAEFGEPVYQAFCAELERLGSPVQRGVFGADMALELVNDGPVTVILDAP